jgi:hypothetical protein
MIDGKLIDVPWLPYQKILYITLERHKQIWLKKSRGLGVTTFLLYYLLYKSLTQWSYPDKILVVVGPRLELAQDFVSRYRALFKRNYEPIYKQLSKQSVTECTVNGVKLMAMPSHHVDALRSYTDVKFILADEADYFATNQQQELMSVISGYLGKPNSSPTVALVSTPAAPNGLMQRIELDQQSPWYKLFYDYRYGLEGNPIPTYDIKSIELAQKNPDWSREFEGQYLGLIGNTFSELSLQKCKELAKELEDLPVSKETQKVLAADPAWGTGSRFGIVGLEYLKDLGKFRVIMADEYAHPHMNDILDLIWNTKKELGNVSNIYVDAASAVMVQSLKRV